MPDTSSPPPEFLEPENDDLGHEFRIVLVVQREEEQDNEMEEFNLSNVTTFSKMNEFFDQFDEQIAIPNKGHIKYDVGSDGLVVIVVETADVKESVTKFIEEYKFTEE